MEGRSHQHRLRSLALLIAAAVVGCGHAPPNQRPADIAIAPGARWVTRTTESYSGKRDDIHFATARVGFYGTGAGDLFRTNDGGASWTKVWSRKGTFIRAVGFVDDNVGFMGNVGDAYPNVTDSNPLYRTSDGGRTWEPVTLPAGGSLIKGICAIDILKTRSVHQGGLRDRVIIHAAGRVGGPAHVLRSTDGGQVWTLIDLTPFAGMVLDVKFLTPDVGFVFAGSATDIRESEARILKTRDGGLTWRIVYRSGRRMENSWKGSFADTRTGYATVQTYDPAREQQVIVKTVDGGETWTELPLVRNAKAREFGIGFATPTIGWVGTAAGGFETRDGGISWAPVSLAPAANKIRTRAGDGTPMVYAIGTQVQSLIAGDVSTGSAK
jgi:photosystem II stability/assembly factor-like uncharacterized protein